jgi:hypothetical protein
MDVQARALLARTRIQERIQEAETDRLARAVKEPKREIARVIRPAILRAPWSRPEALDRNRLAGANPIANTSRVQGGMAVGL